MSRLVRIVVAAAILFALTLPAMGHSTHGHNCLTVHAWVSDGNNWRHNAVARFLNQGGNTYQKSEQRHEEFIIGDGLNKWVFRHYTATAYCVI